MFSFRPDNLRIEPIDSPAIHLSDRPIGRLAGSPGFVSENGSLTDSMVERETIKERG
jgi:hypothetical protein